MTFVQFANKVMSKIYKLIYDQEFPRVTDLMRSQLQSGSEVTGVWFLYAEAIEIRLHGFTGYPFLLPAFLTDRVFALEFARQRKSTF